MYTDQQIIYYRIEKIDEQTLEQHQPSTDEIGIVQDYDERNVVLNALDLFFSGTHGF